MAEETFDSTVAIVPDAQESSHVQEPSGTPSLPQPILPTLAPKMEPQDTLMAEAAVILFHRHGTHTNFC